jgi:hypothetical protein
MADPIKVLQLLGSTPASTYTVFERDQVLTHGQLNELSLYLNQQERLTRTNLVGVGVISGLDLAVEDAAVMVGPGLGITTDGDLVIRPEAVRYTHSKPYDEKQPQYAPFFPDGKTIIKLAELTVETDPLGSPLPTPLSKQDWVVVLLVETTELDPDLCIGENCDNLGRKAMTKIRLLLALSDDAKALRATFQPVSERARSLPDMLATRPLLNTAMANTSLFMSSYRDACSQVLIALNDALQQFGQDFAPELKSLFGSNPIEAWQLRLKDIFGLINIGNAQLIYGFFKDMVDTWNDMVDALLDTTAILLPGSSAFPKHLLLGSLPDPTALRTAFFPSVADTGAREAAARAGFLVRKLQAQMKCFIVPVDTELRITPSKGEEVPLEDRAIPWYYKPDISTQWNYRLNKRQQSETNLGYRAHDYGGSERARKPLASAIAGYEMFRVEGHLGGDINQVRDALKAQVALYNLPFKVHAVLAHNLKKFIRIRPQIRYTDLHRFHYLLRQDVAMRLDEGQHFTTRFSENMQAAVLQKTIPDQLENVVSVTQVVQTARNNMETLSAKAQPALAKTRYTAYREETRQTTWADKLGDQLQMLGDVRSKLGEVSRNDIVSPIDSLIQTTHPTWLSWLDDLIVARDDREDDKLLLSRFVGDHPSLDHLGGTWRGGTFVLLYDDSGQVIGDFALPYSYEEVDEPEPEEPVLPRPPLLRPPIKDITPIGIVRPIKFDLDSMVTSRIDTQFAASSKKLDERILQLNTDVDNRLKFTTSNVEGLVKGAFSVKDATGAAGLGGGRLIATGDTLLDELAQDVDYKRQRVQTLVDLVGRTDLSVDQRSKAQSMLTSAQGELGTAVGTTAEHVVASKTNTASGGAANVASILAQSTMLVTDSAASTTLTAKLGSLEVAATDMNQKVLIGGLKNIGAIRG